MKKFLYILFFFLSSCGYQPIYLNKDLKNFEFKEIVFLGENNINRKIINALSIKENKENKENNRLFISSSSEIKQNSKNSKGQVDSYQTVINVNLIIRNSNDEIIKDKSFKKEFSYNSKQNKFELVEYQNSIRDDLIDKIISDIIIYLNQ
tara:strand:+ start:694 stop:1143 length:450 start_codon:yes stop_codon:yes gene_type:complete